MTRSPIRLASRSPATVRSPLRRASRCNTWTRRCEHKQRLAGVGGDHELPDLPRGQRTRTGHGRRSVVVGLPGRRDLSAAISTEDDQLAPGSALHAGDTDLKGRTFGRGKECRPSRHVRRGVRGRDGQSPVAHRAPQDLLGPEDPDGERRASGGQACHQAPSTPTNTRDLLNKQLGVRRMVRGIGDEVVSGNSCKQPGQRGEPGEIIPAVRTGRQVRRDACTIRSIESAHDVRPELEPHRSAPFGTHCHTHPCSSRMSFSARSA